MSGLAFNQNALLKMLVADEAIPIDELVEVTGIKRHEVIKATGMLYNRGYLKRPALGLYQLSEEGAAAKEAGIELKSGPQGPSAAPCRPHRPQSLRQRAWKVMRMGGKFSTSDLAVACHDAPTKAQHDNIRRYCKALCDVGILRKLPINEQGASPTSNGFARYILVKNLGMIAPSHQVRKRRVFDHNNNEVYPL